MKTWAEVDKRWILLSLDVTLAGTRAKVTKSREVFTIGAPADEPRLRLLQAQQQQMKGYGSLMAGVFKLSVHMRARCSHRSERDLKCSKHGNKVEGTVLHDMVMNHADFA